MVDNSEGDADTRKVAHEFDVRYTVEPRTGLSHARKRGLAESKTKAVAFLDDNAVPETDWLEIFLKSFADKSARSLGKVLNFESRLGTQQKSSRNPEKKTEG